MRILITLTVLALLFSCKDPRQGIPESQRNYSEELLRQNDSTCLPATDEFYEFHHINADTVAQALYEANRKYFGPDFDTQPIRDSIYHWLHEEYFSTRTYLDESWTLFTATEKTRFTTTFHSFSGLEDQGLQLFYKNRICLRKFISNEGDVDYQWDNNHVTYSSFKHKLRFVCDFNIDIRYSPRTLLWKDKSEYYRVTLRDTVDMFTVMTDSTYLP